MTATETYRYRGYDIVPMWQWSSWCAGIYDTRADLPIFSQSTLSTMAFCIGSPATLQRGFFMRVEVRCFLEQVRRRRHP